jgi:alpha-galactosidase
MRTTKVSLDKKSNFPRILCLLLVTLLLGIPAGIVSGEEGIMVKEYKQYLLGEKAPRDAIWLDSLDITQTQQGWGKAQAGKSVDGNPLNLDGVTYPHGLGTHAGSELWIDLKGAAKKFVAMVGVDDEVGEQGSIRFEVWVDDELMGLSKVIKGSEKPQFMYVDLTGVKTMLLVVEDAGDNIHYDHADWAGALIYMDPQRQEKPQVVAPPPVPEPALGEGETVKPMIHGPRVVGATPGHEFMFMIPATGKQPLTFAADNLPEGLILDARTGIISGTLKKAGATVADLSVSNSAGGTERKLVIVGGKHKLALIPPMGWNSWNVWGTSVDDAKVRVAADTMVDSGLAAHGFQYVNIDDGWEADRDENGIILCNEKFPDMKALADYVHSKGLKLGIYSSPGPKTCAGYEGTYQHEQQDADTWAMWGIDYIKYDWCSYGQVATGEGRAMQMKPYQVMRKALDNCGRDIVYSLCQYGMDSVWEWGADETVMGDLWRTTGDITDTWSSMITIGMRNTEIASYNQPGHWNDADMMVLGKVGWGPNVRDTKLNKQEQLTHVTLWSLLGTPILLGCDMGQLDDFTIALLTNTEVNDVHQDPVAKPLRLISKSDDNKLQIWAKPLWDGTWAVGLFNTSHYLKPREITVKWADLKLKGSRQPVRDLWQLKDLGLQKDSFTATIPRHGVVMIKVGKAQPEDEAIKHVVKMYQ